MEAPSRHRAEDLSKEDLLAMFLQLEISAETASQQSTLEKAAIKEKALVLLKRCRDLEGRQGDYDTLKSKVDMYESAAFTRNEEKQGDAQHAQTVLKGDVAETVEKEREREERFRLLQGDYDSKVAEAVAARADAVDLTNQGAHHLCIIFLYSYNYYYHCCYE